MLNRNFGQIEVSVCRIPHAIRGIQMRASLHTFTKKNAIRLDVGIPLESKSLIVTEMEPPKNISERLFEFCHFVASS